MKFIRDAIYGYLPVTRLEIAFLGHPAILRLHRVIQNSTLFLTYPNNRGTRFVHSVGSMHVAGEMFKSLIHNSKPDYVKRLHKAVVNLFETIRQPGYITESEKYLSERQNSDSEVDDFFKSTGWQMGSNKTENGQSVANNILLQAIRLAALSHDIGHAPYSHAVEFALSDWMKICDAEVGTAAGAHKGAVKSQAQELFKTYRDVLNRGHKKLYIRRGHDYDTHLHEHAGVVLMNKLYHQRLLTDDEELHKDFWTACLQACLQILTVAQYGDYQSSHFDLLLEDPEEYSDLIEWYPLGQVISGAVDCDRLDYLRRDAYNSGAPELASYDQGRIINNLTLAEPKFPSEAAPHGSRQFLAPAFDRRALSALTDFFTSRTRQYRWLTNHHNVVRTDLALARIIMDLANIWETGSPGEIYELLKAQEIWRLWTWDNIETEYRYNDDARLETLLQNLHRLIKNKELAADAPIVSEIYLYLEVLFDRSKERLIPLWKREDDFQLFADGFANFFHSQEARKLTAALQVTASLEEDEGRGNLAAELKDLANPKNTNHRFITNKLLVDWVRLTGRGPYAATLEIERNLYQKHNYRIAGALKVPSGPSNVLVVLRDEHNARRTEFLKTLSLSVRRQEEQKLDELVFYCFQIDGPGDSRRITDVKDFGRSFAREFLELLTIKSVAISSDFKR
jgi:hypothetical protein